ncbi:MAG TPA: hypothetical protein VMC81_05625 [Rhodocyclaceae bacterium]|nr:hypothetical protein [Rhodocyclaceae bacterium]
MDEDIGTGERRWNGWGRSGTEYPLKLGYRNALVCDGSMISANPGVNPSLSITAIAEYIMAQVPDRATGAGGKPAPSDRS